MQTSIHSRKVMKTFGNKFEQMFLVVHLSFWIVDETFVRKSTNICKSFVGNDASQMYPYSMCQPMPTGLYKRWNLSSQTGWLTTRQSKTRSFENTVKSSCQQLKPEFKIEIFHTTVRQIKTDFFSVDGVLYSWHHCDRGKSLLWLLLFLWKSTSFLSLMKISNVAVGKENSMNWDEAINRRQVPLS